MSPDYEAIIAETAKRNGVGLRRDDAVMVLATVISCITEEQLAASARLIELQRSRHEELADKWRRDAKAAAEAVLNASLEAARRNLASGLGEGAEKLVAKLRLETEAVLSRQRATVRETAAEFRRYAVWMLAACGLALLGAIAIALVLPR